MTAEEEPTGVVAGRGVARVYLTVPYVEREMAKALGAHWDARQCRWYVGAGVDLAPFVRWRSVDAVEGGAYAARPAERRGRQFLAVPFSERGLARRAGARWDGEAKAWFAAPGSDMVALRRWRLRQGAADLALTQAPSRVLNQDPAQEFADALREMGGAIGGATPLRLDGQPHRLPAAGDHHGGQAIFYVAHLDGVVPRGYIKNHRTGEERRWVARGYTLSEQQRAELRALTAQQALQRAQEQRARHRRVAEQVERRLARLSPARKRTPYMESKGIALYAGVFADARGTTFVPARDADGRLWTMQRIYPDGTKRFVKGGKKTGCFHVVGGHERLDRASVLVVAEGYATAATLAELLDVPVVAAFDSSNLQPVAVALQRRYPNKPMVVAGDDDLALLQNPQVAWNVGREQAERAAKAAGGLLLLPVFAPGEQQADPKRFSDFNDLVTLSVLGRDAAQRQVRRVYDEALAQARKFCAPSIMPTCRRQTQRGRRRG